MSCCIEKYRSGMKLTYRDHYYILIAILVGVALGQICGTLVGLVLFWVTR